MWRQIPLKAADALGLSQYEGAQLAGFHHHATLCIAAYAFLILQRLRGKKTSLRSNKAA